MTSSPYFLFNVKPSIPHCNNNLKQLALALHNYSDIHRKLPPGYLLTLIADGSRYSNICWGWGSFVLPFVEQSSVYDSLEVGKSTLYDTVAIADKLPLMQKELSAYRCPSDIQGETNATRLVNGQALANANYVGNINSDYWTEVDDADTAGVFAFEKSIKFTDILDGTSNTIALGERSWQYRDKDGTRRWARSAMVFGIGHRNEPDRLGDQLTVGAFKLNLDGTDQSQETSTNHRGMQGYSSRLFHARPGGRVWRYVKGVLHLKVCSPPATAAGQCERALGICVTT